jgi:hypothetical protein
MLIGRAVMQLRAFFKTDRRQSDRNRTKNKNKQKEKFRFPVSKRLIRARTKVVNSTEQVLCNILSTNHFFLSNEQERSYSSKTSVTPTKQTAIPVRKPDRAS